MDDGSSSFAQLHTLAVQNSKRGGVLFGRRREQQAGGIQRHRLPVIEEVIEHSFHLRIAEQLQERLCQQSGRFAPVPGPEHGAEYLDVQRSAAAEIAIHVIKAAALIVPALAAAPGSVRAGAADEGHAEGTARARP
ncbi:hypothetical protein D3C75_921440 [compost metagenome]